MLSEVCPPLSFKETDMRWMLFVVAFLAGTAEARECREPYWENKNLKGMGDFAKCVNERLAELETENAQLKDDVKDLEKTLDGLPGEMTDMNGRVTRSGGGNLTRAGFALDGRARQAAMGMDIDQKALEKLCGEGCSLTLVLTAVGLREGDAAPVFATGPCAFQYKAKSGAWTRGGDCGETMAGVDGNGSVAGDTGAEVIAEAGAACILADSEPAKGVGSEAQPLAADRDKGLVLIANPALWKGSEQRFRCDLKIAR